MVDMKIFTDKTFSILCDPNVLGNKLPTKYIYQSTSREQKQAIEIIEKYLEHKRDIDLLKMAFDEDSEMLLGKLLKLKNEENWYLLTDKYLTSLLHLLKREIKNIKPELGSKIPIELINDITHFIPIYKDGDVLNHDLIINGVVEIDYIARGKNNSDQLYSPNYTRKFEIFRDTQFTISLNFNQGLFVWYYLNVDPSHRGKGFGKALVKNIETYAHKIGFNRFSVEWPNRGFWVKHLNYNVEDEWLFQIEDDYAYSIEGYKEI